MGRFSFDILKRDKVSQARLGVFSTPHGLIHTPYFFPVATQATVKTLTPADLKDIGIEAILANTYHLHLRPGEEVIKKLGGLHEFMNWPGSIATDSGGFQVFSLGFGKDHGVGKIASIFPGEGKLSMTGPTCHDRSDLSIGKQPKQLKISEEGVEFVSHLDGKKLKLTPEISIKIQEKLGANIIFAFDECTSPLASSQYTKKAMGRTHRWAKRCLAAQKRKDQALFGIIQGGAWKDLREESARFIENLPFEGIALGGSLGKSKKEMFKISEWTVPFLKIPRPRHLLGIGTPEDILEAVARGFDLFDCVWPTRLARHGTFLTRKGRVNIILARHKKDKKPLEKNCLCYTCQNFSRAYLYHLFLAKEMLGPRLATIHNLYFMNNFLKEIRQSIKKNKFKEFYVKNRRLLR